MGNFYVNHTVRAPQDRVVAVLERGGHTAYVSPTIDGYTVVYDEACDDQDPYAITELGKELSRSLKSPAVAFLNHDDDILCYWLFENGRPVAEYNSCPDYFDDDEGMEYPDDAADPGSGDTDDGTALCRLFGRPGSRRRVQSLLANPDRCFVVMMHEELVQALGLPECVVGTGYRYIAEGDAGVSADECVHVTGRGSGRRNLHIFGGDDE